MEKIAILGGCRTPFAKYHTNFKDLTAVDLSVPAVNGLMKRVPVPIEQIDEMIWGSVYPSPGIYNLAREIALKALSPRIAGVTVSQACLSSAWAVTAAFDALQTSPEKIIIAGGSESLSNMPIYFPDRLVKRLYTQTYATSKFRRLLASLRWYPEDYVPKIPRLVEPSTGLTMGQYGERIAGIFKISREEQDQWALRSHLRAGGAAESPDIEPVEVGTKKKAWIVTDNCIVGDTTQEKLAALAPAFDPVGTVTAGNSSKPADGACAVMLTSERNARRLGLEPSCYIKAYSYASLPLDDEMLLAPALAIPALCLKAGISLKDINVIEMHEAFAAQVLATFKAMNSKEFMDRHSQLFVGPADVEMECVNTWGGSLAYGHPFGATGARLIIQAMRRITRLGGGGLGLVASCSAGGLGMAMLLEGPVRKD